MRVRATISFTGRVRGRVFHAAEGSEFELPEDVDWLAAGLVEPAGPEAAVLEAPEKAVKAKPRKRAASRKKKASK